MQFLLIGTVSPAGKADPPDDLVRLRAREQATAQDYYRRGIFRQVWTIEGGAVVVCEAETREQIEEHVAALPMVGTGYLDVSIRALDPYAGFGPGAAGPRPD